MLIKIRLLNEVGVTAFETQTTIDALSLMIFAEDREALARQQGADWTAGAIPFFAQQFASAVKAGDGNKAVEKAAIDMAMAAWLSDSLYGRLDAESFMRSDLAFTITPDGVVKYDRVQYKATL